MVTRYLKMQRRRGHDGTPLLVPHFGVPYFKKMKVGYIASVLTDETIELYPTFWGTIFQDDDDD